MLIYKVTNTLNNKVYIGRTNRTLEQRKKQHYNRAKVCTTHFANALNKYPKEVLIWEVIAHAFTYEDSGIIEQQLIEFFDSYNNGYNSTIGGEGVIGGPGPFKNTPVTQEQLENLWAGREKWLATIDKHPLKDKPKSEETKQKLTKIFNEKYASGWSPNKGKKRSEESKKKMSESAKKRELPASLPQRKQVIDSNGIIYYSIREAAKFNNIHEKTLNNWLNGICLQPKKYNIKFFIYNTENK